MERRGFLSLLIATPVLAKLAPEVFAKVPPAPAPAAPPVLLGEGVIQRMVCPFSADMIIGDPDLRNGWIDPGRVARYSVRLQVPFLPRRLVIRSEGTAGQAPVDLLSVAANGEPQIEADDYLSSDLFDIRSFGDPDALWSFAPVPPGQTIVLAVRNPHAFPVTFNAAMLGDVRAPAPCGAVVPDNGRKCWLRKGHAGICQADVFDDEDELDGDEEIPDSDDFDDDDFPEQW